MTPIQEAQLEVIAIAIRMKTIMQWMIENQEKLAPATMIFVGAAMMQIGRHANVFAKITTYPHVYHGLLPGQKSIFY